MKGKYKNESGLNNCKFKSLLNFFARHIPRRLTNCYKILLWSRYGLASWHVDARRPYAPMRSLSTCLTRAAGTPLGWTWSWRTHWRSSFSWSSTCRLDERVHVPYTLVKVTRVYLLIVDEVLVRCW